MQYFQAQVSNVGELERRLEGAGRGIGLRLLELLVYRERSGRRDLRLLDALRFVHSTLWKYLFGRAAQDLEQSNTAEDEYMISDADIFVTKFISVPKEMGHLNCAAFVAGIVGGVLDGAGFPSRCGGGGVGRGRETGLRAVGVLRGVPVGSVCSLCKCAEGLL